jgi:hypothetical protein
MAHKLCPPYIWICYLKDIPSDVLGILKPNSTYPLFIVSLLFFQNSETLITCPAVYMWNQIIWKQFYVQGEVSQLSRQVQLIKWNKIWRNRCNKFNFNNCIMYVQWCYERKEYCVLNLRECKSKMLMRQRWHKCLRWYSGPSAKGNFIT